MSFRTVLVGFEKPIQPESKEVGISKTLQPQFRQEIYLMFEITSKCEFFSVDPVRR